MINTLDGRLAANNKLKTKEQPHRIWIYGALNKFLLYTIRIHMHVSTQYLRNTRINYYQACILIL